MGRGYWKFDNSILLDNSYIELIKKVICDFQINNPKGHVSLHTLWESLKCVIWGETIKCCSIKKKQRNKLQLFLESKISAVESRLHNCDPIDRNDILSSINTARNNLDQLMENNTKGASVRSRARWIEFGEKNSKYFFGLKKRHNDKKSIRLLRNSQGVLISQQENVSNELVDFYKFLYSEDQHLTENECFEFLQKFSPPTISATEKQNCDRPITKNECFKAISQLSNNKSPRSG